MPDCHALCKNIESSKDEILTRFTLSRNVLQGIGFTQDDYELAIRVTQDFYDGNIDFIKQIAKDWNRPIFIEIWPEKFFYFIFKWEFNFIDNLGKASALATDQIDVENAERYGISYVDENGEKQKFITRIRYYRAEQRIAENIFRILKSKAYTIFESESSLIEEQERKVGLKLDQAQMDAVSAVLKHKVLIVTGGPGTGKTTLVRFILGLMRPKIPSIALAAPTGRAAKRITETTGSSSSTIHRLLEATNVGFQRNRENPLDQELIIIDETSMIDTLLMDSLLEAVPSASRLIIVGDVDQLPSVGAGTVLQDFIKSGTIPVVRLNHIFRQAYGSFITVNAHKVRLGELPSVNKSSKQSDLKNQLQDYYFIEESDQNKIVEKILLLNTERIPQRFKLDPMKEIQVLTPMHRGITGASQLNRNLQGKINPDAKGIEHREQWFRVGDKIMQQQNDYEKQVFNGDLGRVVDCDQDSKELYVKFEQSHIHYKSNELDQLTLAYAITVHKSQGSEYSAVIMPITTHHYMMLQRNLLYTAITRGKQLVVLIGTSAAVRIAVENQGTLNRYTGLLNQFSEWGTNY